MFMHAGLPVCGPTWCLGGCKRRILNTYRSGSHWSSSKKRGVHVTAGHLLLGLFSREPVDLRGTIDVGDGSSQLDVLSVVSSSTSCTWSPQVTAAFSINLHNTRSENLWEKSRTSNSLSVSDVTRWMVFITSLTTPLLPPRTPPPFSSPFSAWKEAWCPLKSQTRAKETLLSPGNLGPAESPQSKGKLHEWEALQTSIRARWKRRLAHFSGSCTSEINFNPNLIWKLNLMMWLVWFLSQSHAVANPADQSRLCFWIRYRSNKWKQS